MRHEAMCFIPDVEASPSFVSGADVYQHGDIVTMTPTSNPPDVLITAVRYVGDAPFLTLRQQNGDGQVLVQDIGMEGIIQILEEAGFHLFDASTNQRLSTDEVDQTVKQQVILRAEVLQ